MQCHTCYYVVKAEFESNNIGLSVLRITDAHVILAGHNFFPVILYY